MSNGKTNYRFEARFRGAMGKCRSPLNVPAETFESARDQGINYARQEAETLRAGPDSDRELADLIETASGDVAEWKGPNENEWNGANQCEVRILIKAAEEGPWVKSQHIRSTSRD